MGKKNIHISRSAVALLLFISILSAAGRCDKSSPMDTASLYPDMLVKNFSSTSYQEGTLSWKLSANESSYYYEENRSIAKDVTLVYYENNIVSTTVKAESAEISLDSNDIRLRGNIDMVSTSGNRLLTDEITWNNREKFLQTDEPVKIIKKNGDIIEGTGLKADYDLEYYEIKKKVKAITSNVGKEKNEK